MSATIPPGHLPRRLFERFNKGVEQAREAYDMHPQSTHRQIGAAAFLRRHDKPQWGTENRRMS